MSMPQTFGEGLTVLGRAIAGRVQDKRLGKQEDAERARVTEQFSGLTGAAPQAPAQGGYTGGGQPRDPLDPVSISGDTMAALGKDSGTAGYRASLVGTESGGNWKAQNSEVGAGGKAGHYGRVQFGQARLQEAMNAGAIPQGTTPEQFMSSPALQIAAENWHFGDLENQLGDLVGTVVNGKPLDMGALVAMGHLGGAGGARKYVESGGAYNPSDSFGTSLADYASTHGGQPVSMSAKGEGAPMAPNQAIVAQLTELAGNPYATDAQKAVAAELLKTEMAKMTPPDPMDALALEKAQLEVEAMKNPSLNPMDAIKLKQAELDYNQDLTGDGAGATEYGTTLQFFTDPEDGKLKAGVIGKDGTFKAVDPPGGGEWAQGVDKVDAGTKWLFYDKRTGAMVGEEPKDLRGAEAEKVIGEAEGKTAVSAPGDIATADTTLSYITSLRDHPGREIGSGGSAYVGMIPGTNAKEFQIEVERLKSGAFMTAIQQLRGMGALSNAEGQTATAAVAALDPYGTEEGFLKRLSEYEEIVQRGRDRAAGRIKAPEGDAPASDADADAELMRKYGVAP
jgi:hypothetical protein